MILIGPELLTKRIVVSTSLIRVENIDLYDTNCEMLQK